MSFTYIKTNRGPCGTLLLSFFGEAKKPIDASQNKIKLNQELVYKYHICLT